ncbi:MAG: AAA family ATPase [Gemmatimonadetes bacterium]|nr:AAA family ATPase [Gemmatimonadota bacterium]
METHSRSVSCPRCAAEAPASAKYCSECGNRIASTADAERRIITVLFADLSGFTALTEQLDPEQVRSLIAGCLAPLCDCVTRWGGFVDKFMGDCVMALFGAPIAYENEEERAVRAALEMREALQRWAASDAATAIWQSLDAADDRVLSPGSKSPLQLKVGVNTGSVVTGVFAGGGAHNYTAVGDAVNVAARLQSACEPGEILIGTSTCEQTSHLFEFGDERSLVVKGKQEPVRARSVTGLRPERGRSRGFRGRLTRFIGREAQLKSLRENWSRAKAGHFSYCLVTGAPGIGKTRLISEFRAMEKLTPEEFAGGRSYPYARSAPWEPLAELLRDLYDVPLELEPIEAAATIAKATRTDWSGEAVAALAVALGNPASELAELDGYKGKELGVQISESVEEALRAGTSGPMVLVLEDLQWADYATLDFLTRLPALGLDRPALMVLVARLPLPEERHLGRLFEAIADEVDLSKLTSSESLALVDAVLGEHDLPEPFTRLIVERTEGNPLFIEELLKSMAARGVILEEEGRWRAAADLRDVPVPDTVESLLSTSIDGLGASTRRVLQYAAIVGRRFWSGVLQDALVLESVDGELRELVESAMVRALPHSLVAGDREYAFEHRLLQQVAYDGLLRGLRAELHGSVARWLEQRLSDTDFDAGGLVASHYERSTTPERAIPYLKREAEEARSRGALRDACEMVDRSLRVATRDDRRTELLCLAEEIAAERGDPEARLAAIRELEKAARAGADKTLEAEVEFRRAAYLLSVGQLAEAKLAGEEALDRFRHLGARSREADSYSLLGRVAHLWGDHARAREHYEASLPLQREAGDLAGEAEILDRLGLVEVDLDDFCRALEYFNRVANLCAQLGHRHMHMEVRVLAHRATALRWLGCYEEAEKAARQGLELAHEGGSRASLSTAEMTLGVVLAAMGRVTEAIRYLMSALENAAEIGRVALEARIWLSLAEISEGEEAADRANRARELAARTGLVHVDILALARLAEIALDDGDLSAADRMSAAALAKLYKHGAIQGPEEVVLYARGRVLAAAGRNREAAAMFEEAQETIRTKADRIEDPEVRRRFLEDVHPNQAILELELTT